MTDYKETFDPTKNVLQLVEAAVKRIDDLQKAESRRLEDLRISEIKRVDELMALRCIYEDKLTVAEAKRIDAIRAVDVAAVSTATERATVQAQMLAAQVSTSAETLRALVASTAAAAATQQAQIQSALTERIAALEKSLYLGAGKQEVVDPMMANLVDEIKKLKTLRDEDIGKAKGSVDFRSYVVAGFGILFGIIGVVLTVLNLIN